MLQLTIQLPKYLPLDFSTSWYATKITDWPIFEYWIGVFEYNFVDPDSAELHRRVNVKYVTNLCMLELNVKKKQSEI